MQDICEVKRIEYIATARSLVLVPRVLRTTINPWVTLTYGALSGFPRELEEGLSVMAVV